MKKLFIIPILLLFSASYTPFNNCPCNDTGKAAHKRIEVKDRKPSGTEEATTMAVSDILQLTITPREQAEIKQNDNFILEREKKVVTVSGYAWVIKISDEDCDIHIELSETNSPTAQRIIAEIPNVSYYCTLHTQIRNDLTEKFHLNSKADYRFDKGDNQGKPLHLTVTGFLFWDSGHPTNRNHGTEFVGSVWEVHPASKLSWN